MTDQTTRPTNELPRRAGSGMQTRTVNAAAGVLLGAMENGRRTPTGMAIALDAAGLLNSAEHAGDYKHYRTAFEAQKARADTLDQLLRTAQDRIAGLEAERHTTNEALDDAVQALRTDRDHVTEAYPGELVMLRGLVATLRVVAEHGDLADVVKLLDEHRRDEQDAFAEMGGA